MNCVDSQKGVGELGVGVNGRQSAFRREVGSMFLSRRQFLKVTAGTVAAVAVADKVLALTALQPVIEVGNPLGDYPDRSWERVYHDQYRYDSSFTWCLFPERHARLPRPGLRPERRRDAGRAELRPPDL